MDKQDNEPIKNVSSKGTGFLEQMTHAKEPPTPSVLQRVLLWLRSCLALAKK